MKNEFESPPVQRKYRDINVDMKQSPSQKRSKKQPESPGIYLIYEKKRKVKGNQERI
jgi:hypothetical protein